MRAPLLHLAAGLLLMAAASGVSAQDPLGEIFASWNSTTSPGCAVGVHRADLPAPVLRAWGMAELEHGVPNTPSTIFEAGSVSKQFTAAAVILLELDGVLSLDDEVRRWIPELPDYAPHYEGRQITLRHLVQHTSGLRDWGAVAAIGGWSRGERTHTHDHVLEIAARQEALNYTPGDAYSYTNTGYNLLAMIVERAAGVPFAEFSQARIFEPLGLRHTQWRDDYRRVVPGRSGAYQWRGEGWAIDRPVEHVHGNGGLLTTVEDLLRWSQAVEAAARGEASGDALGGAAFHQRMHEQGVLNDGEVIEYAGGVFAGSLDGRRAVTHTGATAGYRAYLGTFPDEGVAVALLCNTGNANPGQLGARVARLFLPSGGVAATAATPSGTAERPSPQPAAQPAAQAAAQSAAQSAAQAPADREAEPFSPPSRAALHDFVGSYESREAETTWRVAVEEDALVLFRRPAQRTVLRATAPDTFQGAGGELVFLRDDEGVVTHLSVRQARVWDLRFLRSVED
jgi:CubicO group peptidase (beta-lactamase class C family)